MQTRYKTAAGDGTSSMTRSTQQASVGRTLVAILENGQQPDSSIAAAGGAMAVTYGGVKELRA